MLRFPSDDLPQARRLAATELTKPAEKISDLVKFYEKRKEIFEVCACDEKGI